MRCVSTFINKIKYAFASEFVPRVSCTSNSRLCEQREYLHLCAWPGQIWAERGEGFGGSRGYGSVQLQNKLMSSRHNSILSALKKERMDLGVPMES
jgi:hypothetical protein